MRIGLSIRTAWNSSAWGARRRISAGTQSSGYYICSATNMKIFEHVSLLDFTVMVTQSWHH